MERRWTAKKDERWKARLAARHAAARERDAKLETIEPLREALLAATDAAGIAQLVPRVDAHVRAHPRTETAGVLLGTLGAAWLEAGRCDEADTAYARAAVHDPEGSAMALIDRAEVSERRGDTNGALRYLHQASRAPSLDTHFSLMDARNTAAIATERLARIQESLGRWSRARATWMRWRPVSWCGNEADAMAEERVFGIARCEFELGQQDHAFADVRALVVEHSCLNGLHPGAMVLYIDMCLRANRLADARALVWGLSEGPEFPTEWDLELGLDRSLQFRPFEQRARLSLAIAEAAEAAAPERVIAALSAFDGLETRGGADVEWQLAARCLLRLGDRGRDALAAGIRAGDVNAIALAGLSGFRELSPLLEGARTGDEELDELIAEALERLHRSVTPPIRAASLMGG